MQRQFESTLQTKYESMVISLQVKSIFFSIRQLISYA